MIVSKEVAKIKIEYYDKYYINGSDHYLIPRDEFVELFDEMVNWREESKKQKESIDKVIEIIEPLTEFDTCTINGKILRKPLGILKEVSE